MAGLSRAPGIREQVRLIAGLRWRMQRNALQRREARLDFIGMILGAALAVLFAAWIAAMLGIGAYAIVSGGRAELAAVLFWAVFAFWQLAPVFLAGLMQRFEFRTLLRFPIRLGVFYLLSLAYGTADFVSAAGLLWTGAVVAGAGRARPEMLAQFLLIGALFVAVNVPLERFTGTLLERLLSRRRTRELLFALFVLVLFGVQIVAPVFTEHGMDYLPRARGALRILAGLPPGLAGSAFAAAAKGQFAALLWSAAALAGYALVAGGLLWRQLAAQYRAEEAGETPAAGRSTARSGAGKKEARHLVLDRLAPVVEAIARKEFRYLLRNSFLLFQLALPPIFVLLIGTLLAHAGRNQPGEIFETMSRETLFPVLAGYLLLILMAPAYNSFAYEGQGMQTLLAAPVRFREVLEGKNLVQASVVAAELAVCFALAGRIVGFPSLPVLIATFEAVIFSAASQFIVANWSSLTFPRQQEFGALRNQRGSAMAVLVMFAMQVIVGSACGAVFAAGRWMREPWLAAGVFAVLAGAAVAGYWASLEGLSGLAERKSERLMEALCR